MKAWKMRGLFLFCFGVPFESYLLAFLLADIFDL